jgi:predicted nucleic acid-binding protein
VILVDSNIIMCAAGVEHPHKRLSLHFLERVADGEVEGVIDTQILQEILHRYSSIGQAEDGRTVYDLTREIFPLALPVSVEILDRARALLDEHPGLVARDALHAAVVEIHSLDAICSYDRDFDRIPSIRRVEPEY